jgi:hypothetical protein
MGASGGQSIIRAKIPYGAITRAIRSVRRLKEKQMKPVWLLFISVVSATLGQIFFKKGVFMTGEITLKGSLIGELFRLVLNPFVFSGLVLYVISTIVWLIALSKTTLSFVFPFTALIFVLVMLSPELFS